jgi:outer membrane protein OmpA-like peptidoglycan-associated protein
LKISVTLAFWLGSSLQIVAQNLVLNPGFELYTDCPTGLRQIKKSQHWTSGNTGTPEYFRTDCKYMQGPANSGKAYAGLILFGDYPKAIEYLMTTLAEPLKADSKYCVSFWIRAEESFIYIDQIGVVLTQENLKRSEWAPIKTKPSISSDYGEPIVPQLGWTEVKGEYLAKGGEQFLFLGNFLDPDKHIHFVDEYATRNQGWNSYYYIDDVSVRRKDSEYGCDIPVSSPIKVELKVDTIEVFFATDKDIPTTGELNKLDSLLKLLSIKEIHTCHLYGHTDSDASESYNLDLSNRRNMQIKKWLTAKLTNNVVYKMDYFGESNPKVENISAKNKAMNRRVQVILEYYD